MSFYEIKNKTETNAEVWIYEQIGEDFWGDGVSAKQFCKDLAALDVSTIALHINSPGGSVFDGQAIYNAIKKHKATVTCYIDGIAASIASVIALAADSVVMASNALYMVHNPYGGVMGDAGDMRQMADVLDKVKDTIVGVYSDKTGLPDSQLSELMDAETWMDAQEATELGFADSVGDELAVAACFDFAALGFKNAGKAISRANEEKLASAVDLIEEVIDSNSAEEQQEETGNKGASPDAPSDTTGRVVPRKRLI